MYTLSFPYHRSLSSPSRRTRVSRSFLKQKRKLSQRFREHFSESLLIRFGFGRLGRVASESSSSTLLLVLVVGSPTFDSPIVLPLLVGQT